MKKIIFTLLLLIISTTCYAGTYTGTIGKIEDVLFGYQYPKETDNTRLARIEETIYGKQNNGDIAKRISKLKNDISADMIGQEIKPKEDTFADEEYYEPQAVADSNIQYPAVDELEQLTFKKTFKQTEIKKRLSQLEQKAFGKSYNDDLASRVDRLKAKIKPQSFVQNQIAQSSNNFYTDDISKLNDNYHLDKYETPNIFSYDDYNNSHSPQIKNRQLDKIEKSIFKKSFPNDNRQNRLARLENAIFGTEFSDDNEETRTERIVSAFEAQKSSTKYDSNKFSRNMATAMQIGTIILMVLACIL